jgi:Flp pilus assembly protein TadD
VAHFELSEYPKTVDGFARAIAGQPSLARLHAQRAQALEAAGDVDRAESGWRRAWELDPAGPGTANGLARTSRMRLGATDPRA